MPAAFSSATAVVLHTGGDPPAAATVVGAPLAWRAELPPSWDVPTGVHGGVLGATALRAAADALALTGSAMRAAGDDAPRGDRPLVLRNAHLSFVARPERHELDLTTTVRRRGRTTAHVDVAVADRGAAVDAVLVRALFAKARDGDSWLDTEPPVVAGPDEVPPDAAREDPSSAAWPLGPPPLFDHLDVRPALGALPWEQGWRPDQPARYARWARYREAPTSADGTLDPLCLLPLADLPGPAVWTRFGPGEDLRALVSLEMTVDLLEPVRHEWVLSDYRARWMGDGYVHVDADLWSARRLVATVRQLMLVRRIPPPADGG